MYQFTARTKSLKVCLHDATGQDIGVAAFRDGKYRTDDVEHARALVRAMPGLVEYGVVQLTPIPEPDPEPEAAAPEPSPEAEDDPEEDAEDEPDPAPTTESKPARRGRRKGRTPHEAT